ncbi:dephospho-CoA kinase [Nematocida parisii]|nr:dephospho-CoA kinase [Nematocida parisii]
MKLVGITGGICTGTSTVIEYIEDKGFSVVKKKEVWQFLHSMRRFAKYNIPVDIFTNEKLRILVKPYIVEYIKTRQNFFRLACKSVLFIDLPFLFECGLEEYFTHTIVVTCGPKTQEERIHKKYSTALSKAEKYDESRTIHQIMEVVETEMNMAEKRKKCTYVIDNNKGVENTYSQLDSLLYKYYKYSGFYIAIICISIAAIVLPVLIKYKEKASEISKAINPLIEKIKARITKYSW